MINFAAWYLPVMIQLLLMHKVYVFVLASQAFEV